MPRIYLTNAERQAAQFANKKQLNNRAIRNAIVIGLEDKKMTKAELARQVGITRPTIYRYINDPGMIDWNIMQDIFLVLGISPEVLCKGIG